MKRTPEEERIFRALAQIETPEADLSAALRRTEEPRRNFLLTTLQNRHFLRK